MGHQNSKVNLDDIRNNVVSSYPGIEEQLDIAFDYHDPEKAGFISYSLAEPLLRHLLIQYGLVDYINRFTNSQGEMDLKYVADFLYYIPELESQLKPLQDNVEVVITAGHLKSLAIIWLQKIADVYHADQAQWNKQAEIEKHMQHESTCVNRCQNDQLEREQYNDHLKLSCQVGFDQNFNGMYNVPNTDFQFENQGVTMNSYMNQIHNNPYQSNDYGVKCFVYPTANIPGGVCTSAGAILPMRRPRSPLYNGVRRQKQKPFTRCC
ncbi:G2 protein, putative [Babesia microti strain RI]|uniref:G2 protein, putative n=1 Tax=Babesia microti (strain RI) TaxID=1133968 RepID=A0A1R4AAM1_BABMR|nr:G2 protein, putative [Babesia microti strain RI]SJK86040.1 G2 protein, putative [Babesia microti strain RI]|eukprot:XP_021338237.1 G2 protein, putative [Babesia microti strain RI]